MAAADQGIMVYPGAGADVYPLVFPHPFTAHTRQVVMYDGLPGSNYYAGLPSAAKYNTEAKIMGMVLKRLDLWCPAKVVSTEELLDKKYTRITLSDGRIIHYFMNTKDADVIAGDIPAEMKALLAEAGSVFISGYPASAGIFAVMPKLHTIWCDGRGVGNEGTYPAHMLKYYEQFAMDYDSDKEPDQMWIRPRLHSHDEEDGDRDDEEDDDDGDEEDDEGEDDDTDGDDTSEGNEGERPSKRRKLDDSVEGEGDADDDDVGDRDGSQAAVSGPAPAGPSPERARILANLAACREINAMTPEQAAAWRRYREEDNDDIGVAFKRFKSQ